MLIRVKLWSPYIFEGYVPYRTPTDFFARAWADANCTFGGDGELRTLIKGQRTNPDWPFAEYIDSTSTQTKPYAVNLVFQLEGGSTKADQAAKLKEDFSARALQVGFDPVDTKQFVIHLYQEAGAARLRRVMSI